MNTKSVTRLALRPLPLLGAAALLVLPLHAALIAQTAGQSVAHPVAQAASTPAVKPDAAALASLPTVAEPGAVDSEGAEPETRAIGSGVASYYGSELAGNRTASGERFNPREYTAAHRTLPFGSRVQVTSINTGKSVVVRINDRGPFHGGRVIDLSEAAAREIGLVSRGSGQVRLALLAE